MPLPSIDQFLTSTLNVGDGNPNTIPSIAVIGTDTTDNDLAFLTAVGVANTGLVEGNAPDASWTNLFGGVAWSKTLGAAGAVNFSQTLTQMSYVATQFLLTAKPKAGLNVTLTGRGSGSGGTGLQSSLFTPAAGSAIMFFNNSSNAPGATSVTTPSGLTWNLLANIGSSQTTGGFQHGASLVCWYAENAPAVPTQITIHTDIRGTWAYLELGNVRQAGLRLLASTGVGI